jgi:hypothetical protein
MKPMIGRLMGSPLKGPFSADSHLLRGLALPAERRKTRSLEISRGVRILPTTLPRVDGTINDRPETLWLTKNRGGLSACSPCQAHVCCNGRDVSACVLLHFERRPPKHAVPKMIVGRPANWPGLSSAEGSNRYSLTQILQVG